MNAAPHLPTDDDDLIHMLADAYKRTETQESEDWVRVIAQKTNRILADQKADEEKSEL